MLEQQEKLEKNDILKGMIVDQILFESKYPILFTCLKESNVYMFICYFFNASEMKWIGTKTENTTMIKLLQNKITIRDAFLKGDSCKMVVSYNGEKVQCDLVEKNQIPDKNLPTDGEYMDADEDEFAEEIKAFQSRCA